MNNKEFEKLYKRYAPVLYRTAYRMVKNDADALDIVQEAFIRIYNGLSKFRNESHIQTWMYRIVTNLCYDYFRKRKKITFVSEQELFDPDAGQESFQNIHIRDVNEIEQTRKQNLKRALEHLTLRQRTVFNLRIYEELSYEEIAKIMKVKVGTAKATFFQSVEKIKAIMKEMEKK
ncbi:MAG TPA: RNA polymerase sigma factor [bacterium]|nr:RNA polymerase sigma factor [bacterium]HOL35219.1 RNA polymerase sigma factor [bacterium]HPP08705.1 RNA polymerase sigma factor [bacterium]